MTPHNKAKKEEIARVVLMPGDPLRAKWIAEKFLTNAKLVNDVRNMYAYTGTYKGKPVTIMGSGMGLGSTHIYTWELFAPKFYDVDAIIRVGSCGSYTPSIHVKDVLLINESYSYESHNKFIGLPGGSNLQLASPELVEQAKQAAKLIGLNYTETRTNSTDIFYDVRTAQTINEETGASVVEMESYALFANAQLHNKKALTLLTCSDNIAIDEPAMTLEERETSLEQMVVWALETAASL